MQRMPAIDTGWLVEDVRADGHHARPDQAPDRGQQLGVARVFEEHLVLFEVEQLIDRVQWRLRLHLSLGHHHIAHDHEILTAHGLSFNQRNKASLETLDCIGPEQTRQ